MFKQRLLTTLILVPLVLLGIYYGSAHFLVLLVLLGLGLLSWEWLQLIPIQHFFNRVIFLCAVWLLVVPSYYWFELWIFVTVLLWLFNLGFILFFPNSQRIWGNRPFVGGVALVLLPTFAVALSALYQLPQGKDLVVYLFCLVWATDIGAYLAGKQWGKKKLIPRVSPGKTYAGAAGGLFLAGLVACIGSLYFKPLSNWRWFAISLITILLSMVGDLFISMLKRRCQIKDTGAIFPGHGGILDRLDSMIAALPLFYALVRWLI